MGKALEEAVKDLDEKQKHIMKMIDFLKKELNQNKRIVLNVNNNDFTSIINFQVINISNEALVNYLDLKGICVSTGSACSGNSFERSHVLKEIGLTNQQMDSSIRISLSYSNKMEECIEFLKVLKEGIVLLDKEEK